MFQHEFALFVVVLSALVLLDVSICFETRHISKANGLQLFALALEHLIEHGKNNDT